MKEKIVLTEDNISKTLRDVRLAGNMTQPQAGAIMGLGKDYVSGLERGLRRNSGGLALARFISLCHAAGYALEIIPVDKPG